MVDYGPMDLGCVSPFQLRQSAVFETTFAALIVGHLGGKWGRKKTET